jgi:hypothetical protein
MVTNVLLSPAATSFQMHLSEVQNSAQGQAGKRSGGGIRTLVYRLTAGNMGSPNGFVSRCITSGK